MELALAVIAVAYFKFKLNSVLAFWLAYILTRPLGASIGDYLAQSPEYGGLGLGTLVTSAIFLIAILAAVIYLTVTKKDAPRMEDAMVREGEEKKKVREGEEEEEKLEKGREIILGDIGKILSPPLLSENLIFGQYSFHMLCCLTQSI